MAPERGSDRFQLSLDSGHISELLAADDLAPATLAAAAAELASFGGRLGARASAREAGAGIHLQLDTLRETAVGRAIGELAPWEGVRCVRDDILAEYCRDGVVRYRLNHSWTEVAIPPGRLPSLGGAFGLGVVRTLSLAGVLVLHASAFQHGGLTLLALGASGRGKSTLCAAALRAGGRVISDDLVLVAQPHGPTPGQASLRPFRGDMVLRHGAKGMLPATLASSLRAEQGQFEPKLRLPRGMAPGVFAERGTLSCIAVLGDGPRPHDSRVRLLSHAEGLAAVIAALLYQLSPVARRPLLAAATRLAASHPVIALDVGSNLLRAPDLELRRIIESTQEALDIRQRQPSSAARQEPGRAAFVA